MTRVISFFRYVAACASALALWGIPMSSSAAAFESLTGMKGGKDLAPFLTRTFASGSLADFVNAGFKAALAIGAMLAVLQIARGGVLYMTSDAWGKKEQGKQILRDAVTGLLLLLAIWVILDQINPKILNLDIMKSVTPLPAKSQPVQSGSTGCDPITGCP